jgi:DNA-binding winged helix-turn-helix (wHTH) protein
MTACFGSFELDSQRRQLSRAGQLLHLTPKSFDLLLLLVEAAPRVVTKAEIHGRLWPAGVVTDATLVGLVKEVRRVLADHSPQAPIIRTAHRVGYALDLPVVHAHAGASRDSHWLVAGERRLALVAGENIIGRDPAAHVWLDHATLSRRHARLTVQGTHAVLQDLGSKNGTSFAGTVLTGAVTLRSGDAFACGQLAFTYRQAGSAAPTATIMGYIGPGRGA